MLHTNLKTNLINFDGPMIPCAKDLKHRINSLLIEPTDTLIKSVSIRNDLYLTLDVENAQLGLDVKLTLENGGELSVVLLEEHLVDANTFETRVVDHIRKYNEYNIAHR